MFSAKVQVDILKVQVHIIKPSKSKTSKYTIKTKLLTASIGHLFLMRFLYLSTNRRQQCGDFTKFDSTN